MRTARVTLHAARAVHCATQALRHAVFRTADAIGRGGLLAGGRGTLGSAAADRAVRQQATALVAAALRSGTPLAEAAVDRRPALPKAAAQVHVQVGDVVSTQIVVGTIDVRAAGIVAWDLTAVPARAAALTQPCTRSVAADGGAAAADDAVALSALAIHLTGLAQAALAGNDAFALPITAAGARLASAARWGVGRGAVRERAAQTHGFAVGAQGSGAITTTVRRQRTVERAGRVVGGQRAFALAARCVAAAADAVARASTAHPVDTQPRSTVFASDARRAQATLGRRWTEGEISRRALAVAQPSAAARGARPRSAGVWIGP